MAELKVLQFWDFRCKAPEGVNSKREIIANVKGKTGDISSTIDNLVVGGLLVMSPRGKGNNYTITGNGLEVIS